MTFNMLPVGAIFVIRDQTLTVCTEYRKTGEDCAEIEGTDEEIDVSSDPPVVMMAPEVGAY